MGSGQRKVPVKVVAATVAGNALEFFDFGVYAFFAVYIAEAFFPAKTAFTSLLVAVGVFGVGFVFRPLGSVVFGAYADRVGRRPAMLLTIAMITVGTAGLALTPSYAAIGMAAPVIVILCRVIQGLALGGEVGPASAYLIEIAPPGRRGLYLSWQLASQGIALMTAGALGMVLTLTLDTATMVAWGWRVPFLLCLLLIPVGLYLRRSMPETMAGGAATSQRARTMVAKLWDHAGILLLAVLLIMGGTVATYVVSYLTTFAIRVLRFPPSTALSATLVAGCSILAFSVLGGWLADRYGRRTVMFVPCVLLVTFVWPAFLLLTAYPTVATLYGTAILLAGLTAVGGTATLTTIPELLPSSIRATGLAIAYAIGVSLFGGTTQFIVTWLIDATTDAISPAWYVMFTNLVTLAAIVTIPESRDRKLES